MAADYTYSMNMKLACSTHCCWGTTWWSLCTPPGRPCRYRWVSLENQTGQYLNRAIRWRINTALLQSGNKQTERGENPFLPTISPFCHQLQVCLFHDKWKLLKNINHTWHCNFDKLNTMEDRAMENKKA